jgi:hypothetical protein
VTENLAVLRACCGHEIFDRIGAHGIPRMGIEQPDFIASLSQKCERLPPLISQALAKGLVVSVPIALLKITDG